MLRNQAEEGTSGATMFKSGGAVVKRGYVWNQTATAATIYNLRMNDAVARTSATTCGFNAMVAGLRAEQQRKDAQGANSDIWRRYFFDALAGAGSKTSAATSPTADATAAAKNSQT